jgi:hypothetical protein
LSSVMKGDTGDDNITNATKLFQHGGRSGPRCRLIARHFNYVVGWER